MFGNPNIRPGVADLDLGFLVSQFIDQGYNKVIITHKLYSFCFKKYQRGKNQGFLRFGSGSTSSLPGSVTLSEHNQLNQLNGYSLSATQKAWYLY